jgi:hypothetical protein
VDLPAALRFENQWMDHLFTGARYALLLRKDDTIARSGIIRSPVPITSDQ